MVKINDVDSNIKVNSVRKSQGKKKSKALLYIMVTLGMAISGLIESTVFPKPIESNVLGFTVLASSSVNGTTRRYCDPPNMTAMTIYEIYYESQEEVDETDYDFSQMEEMNFQVEISAADSEFQWNWQIFLLGSIVSPAFACWCSVKFGPGRVFGICILLASVLGLFSSTAGAIGRPVIIALQGVIHSTILPSSILLGLVTVAENEITVFLSLLAGRKAGSGLGEIIPDHLLPFTSCIVAVTWFSAWVLIIRTPRTHPQKQPIPWKELITCRVVWMSVIAIMGTELSQIVGLYTLRMYLYYVYHYTARHVLAIPMFCHFIFSLICGRLGKAIGVWRVDMKTASRRLFVYISHFIPAGALFMTGFVGCVDIAPVILYGISTVFSGAAYSGAYASALDISPNFSAIIIALVCTCGAIARLTPVLLTTFILDGMMPGSWRTVLSVSALIVIVTAMIFMLRSSSRVQYWNDLDRHRRRLQRPTARRNVEDRILRVLMVQERGQFTRARACSTSITTKRQILGPKRASIS